MWTGENDRKTISVDANLYENGAKQLRFRLKTDLVWTGLEIVSRVNVNRELKQTTTTTNVTKQKV